MLENSIEISVKGVRERKSSMNGQFIEKKYEWAGLGDIQVKSSKKLETHDRDTKALRSYALKWSISAVL